MTESLVQAMPIWKRSASRPHSLHLLCSRVCSFPAGLPTYFIEKYSEKGDVVFDPWSGKGTVPLEAGIKGRIGIGNDASPEAFVLTYAKTHPVSLKMLKEYFDVLRDKVSGIQLPKELTELDKKAQVFYSVKTFEQLRKVRQTLLDENSDEAIFTKALMLGLLHGSSKISLSLRCSHSYSMSPAYVKKYAKENKLRRPTRDVFTSLLAKAKNVLSDPLSEVCGRAITNDSRKLELKDNSVDLIITSPPYFNIQTYAWCNWLRLWFLGYDFREVRKNLSESGAEEKYRSFIEESLAELYRVLKPGRHGFIVVGDVKRPAGKGKYIYLNTAEFLTPSIVKAGFEIESTEVEDIPTGQRVLTYISANDGVKIERRLHIIKPITV